MAEPGHWSECGRATFLGDSRAPWAARLAQFIRYATGGTVKDSTPSDWRVEMPMGGRDGYIGYFEGPHSAAFYWEFGGGDVVVILHIGQSPGWSKQYPWAADRQGEILERVTQEVIRQRAPTCRADIDETGAYIYFREQKRVA